MTNRRQKRLQQQKLIVGGIAVVVLVILGYLLSLVITEQTIEGFVEGEHYTLIDNPRRIRGDKIEVMEFFSYGCIHCYNFDDEIKAWASKRSDTVNFVQTPAVANEVWRNYGKAFYTMETLGLLKTNHTLMFRQIHDARRNLQTPADFAEVLATGDVTEEQFISTFNSPAVEAKLQRDDQLARRLRVATVPSLVVHGKYQIRATGKVGFTRMLEVADYLIEQETAAKATVSPSSN